MSISSFDPHVAEARRAKLVFEANSIISAAARDKRSDLNEDETARYAAVESELKHLATASQKHASDRAFDFLGSPSSLSGRPMSRGSVMTAAQRMTLGQQITDENNDLGKFLRETRGNRPRHFTSPGVEVMFNATILGGDLAAPHSVPGIASGPMVPATVKDLIPQGQVSTSLVTYQQETAATNNADAVAEGAAKPESSLTFVRAEDAVRKIATWVPVSRESLDDIPYMSSYIDARLRSFVDAETDNQILNGDGIDPNILGLMNRPGLTPARPQGVGENGFDAIAAQYAAIASSQYVLPDAVVLSPSDWIRFLTLKTTTGEYLSGSPFSPFATPTMWGMKAVQSPFMPAGTALVGAFAIGAWLFLNGSMRVEMSTQHQDFFTRNLVAILAEQRAALACLRPGAFGKVTAISFAPPV